MEPKLHPIEKENHFPNLHVWVPCSSSRCELYHHNLIGLNDTGPRPFGDCVNGIRFQVNS